MVCFSILFLFFFLCFVSLFIYLLSLCFGSGVYLLLPYFSVCSARNLTMSFFLQEILPGRRVGLVVINTCASPFIVRQRLMDLYAGKLALPGGRNSSELLGRVMGVVGALYSANSIAASDTLTSLERALVVVRHVPIKFDFILLRKRVMEENKKIEQ